MPGRNLYKRANGSSISDYIQTDKTKQIVFVLLGSFTSARA